MIELAPVDGTRLLVEAALRAMTRRKETPVHAAADTNRGQIKVAVRYAFALGRKAGLKKAPDTVRAALLDVLPSALLKALVAGGRATTISGMRAAARFETLATESLKFRFDASNPRAAKWAKEHAAELAKNISETTRQDIAEAIAKQQAKGSDVDILAAVGDDERADLIARTESMRAANQGQREAWSQAVDSGLLTGDEKRTWIATEDGVVCPICEELDGEEAELDGEYPGGYDAPPAHPNCRCTEGLVG